MSTTHSTPEQYLELPGGRQLAYATGGDSTSTTLIIFFHGVFGIGRVQSLSKALTDRKVYYVAPTLPGWGKSSPQPKDIPFHITLANNVTALINHLYSDKPPLKIYVSGGSYGTVPAQMLYGAPFDIFPLGRHLEGCMLLAPFSPFLYHKDYTKTMTMANYIAVGPPTRYIPFLTWLLTFGIKPKVKDVKTAEKFIRQALFDNMKQEELDMFANWREANGKEEGQLEREFAENMVNSVRESWDGFIECADVIHSDWGFDPSNLDDEHNRRPMYIVGSSGDDMAPDAMAKWLKEAYSNSKLRIEEGGHISGLFKINELWNELLQ